MTKLTGLPFSFGFDQRQGIRRDEPDVRRIDVAGNVVGLEALKALEFLRRGLLTDGVVQRCRLREFVAAVVNVDQNPLDLLAVGHDLERSPPDGAWPLSKSFR